MSATVIGKTHDSGSCEVSRYKITVTQVYRVAVDGFTDDGNVAASATGLPAIGDAHPTAVPTAYAGKGDAKRVSNLLADGTTLWDVTVVYESSDPGDLDINNKEIEPEDQTPTMALNWEDREELVGGTMNSDHVYVLGVRNSAGEKFSDPPATKMVSTVVITITKTYLNSFDFLAAAISYQDAINSDVWLGIPVHSARVVGVIPTTINVYGTDYLQIAYTFKVKPTWDLVLLDIGTYYFETVGGFSKRKTFTTDDGHPRRGLLNGSGGKSVGEVEHWLPALQVYPHKAFSALGLPSSLTGYRFV